jgi:hypothetical protein
MNSRPIAPVPGCRHGQACPRASLAASAGLTLMLAATLVYVGWPRVSSYFGAKPIAAPPVYAAGDRVDVPAAWYAPGAPHAHRLCPGQLQRVRARAAVSEGASSRT